MKAVAALGIAVALASVSMGCGDSADRAGDRGDDTSSGAVVYQILMDRSAALSFGAPPHDLLEALPGTAYSRRDPQIAADALVVGTVTDVQAGQVYAVGTDGTDHRVDVGDGDIQQLVVTLQVNDVVCATSTVPRTVTFGFWVDGTSQEGAVRDDLEGMSPIAVFLAHSTTTSVPAYQTNLDGLLSAVDGDERVPWPVEKEVFGPSWIEGGTSISALRAACPV